MTPVGRREFKSLDISFACLSFVIVVGQAGFSNVEKTL